MSAGLEQEQVGLTSANDQWNLSEANWKSSCMLTACIDWTREETASAASIGEAKMNRVSSTFLATTERRLLFLGEFNRPPSLLDSTSLLGMSSAGSATSDRFNVSGMQQRMTSTARVMKPTLMVNGTKLVDFMRYQEKGTATTVAIKYAAVHWKNTDALWNSYQPGCARDTRHAAYLLSSDATSAIIVKNVDLETGPPPPMKRKTLLAHIHSMAKMLLK